MLFPSADSVVSHGPDVRPTGAQFAALIARIQAGDTSAIQQLYGALGPGIGWFLRRQLHCEHDAADAGQPVLLQLLEDVRRGAIPEPQRIAAYALAIARQHAAQIMEERAKRPPVLSGDERLDPERPSIQSQKLDLMKRVLAGMTQKDRQVLTRFYLNEQTEQQICAEMNISRVQFQDVKTRLEIRCRELGKRKPSTNIGKGKMRAAGTAN
jgi:RNA polymerase sigma-70 factor, ECF subfamily